MVGSGVKARKFSEELVLVECGISKIAGLEQYTNLQVLRLNKNKIRDIVNLGCCFRLSRLYLAQNRIHQITDSCLGMLHQLEVLDLSDNDISGLKDSVEVLGTLHKLRRLSVQGNPIANEENARLYLIYMIPWVEVFDGHAVTPLERENAQSLSKELGWAKGGVAPKARTVFTAFGKGYKRAGVPKLVIGDSECEKILEGTAARIQGIVHRRQEEQRHEMRNNFGVPSKVLPTSALAPYGHDVCKPGSEHPGFVTEFESTTRALNMGKRRSATALDKRSGAQTARGDSELGARFWTVGGSEDVRPKSACNRRAKKDATITLDVDMYARYSRAKRQSKKSTGKLFTVAPPVIGGTQTFEC